MTRSIQGIGRALLKALIIPSLALLTACDFVPQKLSALEKAIEEQVAGEAMALRVGGDTVVVVVAGAPVYGEASATVRATAGEVATMVLSYAEPPVAAISVAFHAETLTDDREAREFIFLVENATAVLQPLLDDNATGPLSADEVMALFAEAMVSEGPEDEACVRREVEQRVQAAGDPETLDPATIEMLPTRSWRLLDPYGKRLILAQVISTQAMFACAKRNAVANP